MRHGNKPQSFNTISQIKEDPGCQSIVVLGTVAVLYVMPVTVAKGAE